MAWTPGANIKARLNNKFAIEAVRTATLIVVLVVVIGVGYFVWRHFWPSKPNTPVGVIDQFGQDNQPVAKSYLAAKDYESYQALEATIAQDYLAAGDFANTQKVMDMVAANVPKNKFDTNSYEVLIRLAQAEKDNAKAKDYCQQLIDWLKSQGRSEQAAQIQVQMDKIK